MGKFLQILRFAAAGFAAIVALGVAGEAIAEVFGIPAEIAACVGIGFFVPALLSRLAK